MQLDMLDERSPIQNMCYPLLLACEVSPRDSTVRSVSAVRAHHHPTDLAFALGLGSRGNACLCLLPAGAELADFDRTVSAEALERIKKLVSRSRVVRKGGWGVAVCSATRPIVFDIRICSNSTLLALCMSTAWGSLVHSFTVSPMGQPQYMISRSLVQFLSLLSERLRWVALLGKCIFFTLTFSWGPKRR